MPLRFNLGATFTDAAITAVMKAKSEGLITDAVATEAIRIISETATKLRGIQFAGSQTTQRLPIVYCRRWGIRSIADPDTWLMVRDGDGREVPFITDLSLDCIARIKMLGRIAHDFWEPAQMSDAIYEQFARRAR